MIFGPSIGFDSPRNIFNLALSWGFSDSPLFENCPTRPTFSNGSCDRIESECYFRLRYVSALRPIYQDH